MILELARIGTYDGTELTGEMLDQMVASFSGDVPVVIGHELADTMPAFGWITSVRREGDALIGEVELAEELRNAVAEGLYRTWSIGARQNDDDTWYLHHLAFLGAVPPKIKGLRILEMNDRNSVVIFGERNFAGSLEARIFELEARLDGEREKAREARKAAFLTAVGRKIPHARMKRVLEYADTNGNDTLFDLLEDLFRTLPDPVGGKTVTTSTTPVHSRTVFTKI